MREEMDFYVQGRTLPRPIQGGSMGISIIAAMTKDRVLSKDGVIPWYISRDLRRFKALTLSHPVLMGRKTWESLPNKLEKRTNIVVSKSPVSGCDEHYTNLR